MAQLNRGHSQVAADWRPALAGVLGGSVSTLLLHPLDLLKTRQAVHGNGESKAARAAYANVATAVRHIVRQEGGAKALYRGVGTNVAVAGTSWGLTFMSYGAIKAQLANRHGDGQPLTSVENFAAALGSGIFTTVAANPLYVVRTRLVMERSRGATAAAVLSQVLRKEGVRGLYKGLGASVLGVSHGAVQLLLYEHIKRNIAGNRDPTICETLVATSVSKVIAALLTYPCQNVRACQQASDGKVRVGDLVRRGGLRSLYRGMLPYLCHVVPNVCLVFAVYELVVGRTKGVSEGEE